MRTSLGTRFVLLCVLCGATVATVVGFTAGYDRHAAHPTGHELDRNFAAHVGEEVQVWVRVAAVGEDRVRTSKGWTLVIEDPPPSADPGDYLQVHGVARPDETVAVESVVVADREQRRLTIGASVLSVALAGALVLRHWRPTARAVLVPRGPVDGGSTGGDGERGGDRR